MRQFVIAAALAMGLIALWAAILPLAAQSAPPHAAATPPALSKALFLCRGPHGIDQACAAALAKAVVLDAPDEAATKTSDRTCRMDRQAFAGVDRHD
jgi:hypothetical protein